MPLPVWRGSSFCFCQNDPERREADQEDGKRQLSDVLERNSWSDCAGLFDLWDILPDAYTGDHCADCKSVPWSGKLLSDEIPGSASFAGRL